MAASQHSMCQNSTDAAGLDMMITLDHVTMQQAPETPIDTAAQQIVRAMHVQQLSRLMYNLIQDLHQRADRPLDSIALKTVFCSYHCQDFCLIAGDVCGNPAEIVIKDSATTGVYDKYDVCLTCVFCDGLQTWAAQHCLHTQAAVKLQSAVVHTWPCSELAAS